MKYMRFLFVIVIIIAGLGFTQPAKAGAFTYTSGISLQNLADATANITIHYYNQDGTEDPNSPVTDTIDPLGSKQYFPIHASDGFNGSVVIESDVQLASIVNVVGDSFAATAAYDGSSSGGSPVLLPLLMKANSGYNTWFNVQNAGGGVATVNVAYSDGTTATATINAGYSHTFDQAAETHTAAVFSGIVTADQPIVATVIEESTQEMFAYSGFITGSTAPIMPLINSNNSGYITGVNILNSSDNETTVTVSYTPSLAGTACTETQTIPARQAKTFALAAFAGAAFDGTTTCVGGATFIGSAIVTQNTASADLTAIVNQLNPGVNAGAYGAFDASAATANAVLPLIMNNNSGFWSSISITNVGGAATTVTCSFANSAVVATADLDPNEGASFLAPVYFGSTTYVGAATCEAPGGLIVATSNELGPSLTDDQLLVYEGFNTQ